MFHTTALRLRAPYFWHTHKVLLSDQIFFTELLHLANDFRNKPRNYGNSKIFTAWSPHRHKIRGRTMSEPYTAAVSGLESMGFGIARNAGLTLPGDA